MYRRIVHRGIAALALVTVLTVAGAQPAAAAGQQGLPGRAAGAWSVIAGESGNLLDRLVRWFDGGERARAPRTRTTTKLGWGIDPNGGWIIAEPAQPQQVGSGH